MLSPSTFLSEAFNNRFVCVNAVGA